MSHDPISLDDWVPELARAQVLARAKRGKEASTRKTGSAGLFDTIMREAKKRIQQCPTILTEEQQYGDMPLVNASYGDKHIPTRELSDEEVIRTGDSDDPSSWDIIDMQKDVTAMEPPHRPPPDKTVVHITVSGTDIKPWAVQWTFDQPFGRVEIYLYAEIQRQLQAIDHEYVHRFRDKTSPTLDAHRTILYKQTEILQYAHAKQGEVWESEMTIKGNRLSIDRQLQDMLLMAFEQMDQHPF